jgi:hypothetical protein
MSRSKRPWLNLFNWALEEAAFGEGWASPAGERCPWCGRLLYDGGALVPMTARQANACPQPRTFTWWFNDEGRIITYRPGDVVRTVHVADPCTVYFLDFPVHRVLKIGWSGNPRARLSAVGGHLVPMECGGSVLASIAGGEVALECILHTEFREQEYLPPNRPGTVELFRPSCRMLALIADALRFPANRPPVPRGAKKPPPVPTVAEVKERRLQVVEGRKRRALDEYLRELDRNGPREWERAEQRYRAALAQADAWLAWAEERERWLQETAVATARSA